MIQHTNYVHVYVKTMTDFRMHAQQLRDAIATLAEKEIPVVLQSDREGNAYHLVTDVVNRWAKDTGSFNVDHVIPFPNSDYIQCIELLRYEPGIDDPGLKTLSARELLDRLDPDNEFNEFNELVIMGDRQILSGAEVVWMDVNSMIVMEDDSDDSDDSAPKHYQPCFVLYPIN